LIKAFALLCPRLLGSIDTGEVWFSIITTRVTGHLASQVTIIAKHQYNVL